ncbi:hypothetical protein MKX07_000441 [Trichoderma sp. CBMAI-0711]|nr:hypothetical protein MKX07_000441 [Trichoderma sp. CBMAI-0711]
MSEQMPAPRITASYLDSFVGRVVTIVGTVTQLRGDQATMDADGIVTILLNRDAHLVNGNAAQIIGKVNPDLSIKALSTRDVGSGVAHGNSSYNNNHNEPQHQPHIAMVWHAAEPLRKSSPPIAESSSSSSPSASFSESSLPLHTQQLQQLQQYHRSQITNRPPQPQEHNFPPTSPSPSPSQTTQDWHHDRQQQWLDRIPYDLSPQHPLMLLDPSSSQSTSSSMPSTAPMPRGFVVNMPGSYYSSRSNSPSAEEQAMFRLAHNSSPPPSQQPTNSSSGNNNRLLSPPPSSFSPIQDPFPTIPSAQPSRFIPPHHNTSSPYESSPLPFTNISSSSTQPTTPLPSPPPSQHQDQQQPRGHRPASPTSSVADSQLTLRQGVASSRPESEYSAPMSPIARPQVLSHIHNYAYGYDRGGSVSVSGKETEAQALSAVVEGIGRMQVNMNLDQAGRWRIARRADAPW